jgi:uncharacterized SAM-binding protein YcdF (DUF218 family)
MQLYGLLRGLLTDPLFWVVAILLIGFLLGHRRPAAFRRWMGAGLLLLVLLGWRALPDRLMHGLETWYAPASQAPSAYAGIVVLGGGLERASVQRGRDDVQMNAHAERLTEAAALARLYPALPIIYTGGCVDDGEGCVAEAELAQRFFTHMGLAPDRMRYESASRTPMKTPC